MTQGDSAEITFTGSRFTLTFTRYSNFGSIDVFIDDVYLDTIVATNPILGWQSTWTSPDLGVGTYTVRFQHAGGGTFIDIDAIRIFEPPIPVGPGTYDDPGPYNNSMHFTSTQDSSAEITFTGSWFTLTFTRYSNFGSIDVFIDNVYLDTIVATSPALAWQSTWTSPDLGAGTYTVRFKHAGGGTFIDIDAIQISPVSPGTYDDTDLAWAFNGSWTTYTGPGPYSNSMHFTSTQGSSAEITFTGSQFTLFFTKYSNFGSIDVYIDNVHLDTIVATSPTLDWQSTWTSPDLGAGTYTVRFEHPGGNNYIAIEAILILPLGPGTYNDTDLAWTYNGDWTVYSGPGPFNDSMHFTSTQGNSAEITFTGSQFTLTFSKYANFGSLDVYVDDVYLDTIVATSSTLEWQSTWTSPDLGADTYTVRFEHAGGGTYIDIEAIQILP